MRVQIEKRDRDGEKEKERSLSLVSVLILLFLFPSASFVGESLWTVSLKSQKVFQGGVVKIIVSGGEMTKVKGLFRSREIPFFTDGHGTHTALLGVDLEERPGPENITIKGWNQSGKVRERLITFCIKKRTFPQEEIAVSVAFDRIDEATRRRIEKERTQRTRLWQTSSPERLWEGHFHLPVSGGITSPFGMRRIVNGSARSPHGGIDLKASLGTEIIATNHGQVALREDFFYSGKTVVLNHGGGLFTMYFHLVEFRVERNSQVRKGNVIGRVGMTGRVTGPHLHWGVRLNGARVDPLELVKATGS